MICRFIIDSVNSESKLIDPTRGLPPDTVRVHHPPDELVNREGESAVHKIDEADALAVAGTRGHLVAGRPRRHFLQRRQEAVAAQRLQRALINGRPLLVTVDLLQPAGRTGGSAGGPLLSGGLLHAGAGHARFGGYKQRSRAQEEKENSGGENGDCTFFTAGAPLFIHRTVQSVPSNIHRVQRSTSSHTRGACVGQPSPAASPTTHEKRGGHHHVVA